MKNWRTYIPTDQWEKIRARSMREEDGHFTVWEIRKRLGFKKETDAASRLVLFGEQARPAGQTWVTEEMVGNLIALKPGLIFLEGDEPRLTGMLERTPRSSGEETSFISATLLDPETNFSIHLSRKEERHPPSEPWHDQQCPAFISINLSHNTRYSLGISQERWAVMEPWLNTWLPVE